jgi:hypothetical protein
MISASANLQLVRKAGALSRLLWAGSVLMNRHYTQLGCVAKILLLPLFPGGGFALSVPLFCS